MSKLYISGDSNIGAVKRSFDLVKDTLPSEFEIEVRHIGLGGGHMGEPFFIDHGDYLEINRFRHTDKTVKYPTIQMKDALAAFILPFYSIRLSANFMWRKSAPSHMVQDEAPISKSILKAMCIVQDVVG